MTPRQLLPLSLLLAVFGLLVEVAQVAPCAGAEPAGEQAQGDLRFRRVFAPADRMKEWPRGPEKYLPVDAAEFERLLSAARRSGAGTPLLAARTTAARYTARLEPDQSLRGEATLEIEQTANHAVILPLDPCNLAMTGTRWLEPSPAPATLGLGDEGDLQTLVERSGRLRFAWSLAGRRDAAEAVVFSFELPPCPINRFALELPLGLTPSLDRGLLLNSRPAGEELRRWEFELGGHNRFHLRILQSGAAGQPRRLALVRQSLVYDLSLRGVEVLGAVEPRGLRPAVAASDGGDGPSVATGHCALRRGGGALVGCFAAGGGPEAHRLDAAGAHPRRRGSAALRRSPRS